MTGRVLAGLLAGALSVAPQIRDDQCDGSPLVIRNVRVWTAGGLLPGRDVMVENGRIASIRPARRDAQAARSLDGTGHTLLPGLVDAHLHFSIPGGLPGSPRPDASAIAARQLLASGVTSGRLHLAALDEAVALKARSQQPCAAIPRLQVGGPGLSGAVERDFSAFQGARTAEDAAAKIARFAAAGVDWVAIHDADRFGPGALEALGSAARNAGLRLMAQGSTPAETLAALSIRPDTLDYIDRTAASSYRPDVLDRLRAARDIVLVPTVGVAYRREEYRRAAARLEDPSNFRFFSPGDRSFVLANARRDLDAPNAAAVLAWGPTISAKLGELRGLGHPVAVGSDAGSPLQFQASAIWWEMEAWRAAGIPNREVVTAATEHGARALRLTDVGHLRPGAHGDFVLYRGNVEEGPFDVGRVLAVARGGVLVR